MELFKLLNGQLILAQVVCFFLALLVLRMFLWKPVFGILEERRKKVDDQMKAIEEAKAEAARLRAEVEQALLKIDETAQKRFKEAEQLGEQRVREMREKARQEAERIIDDARSELKYEFMRSREALKGEIVDMVMKVTEQMIQEKLTFDEDKKIIEGFLTELEKVNEK